MASTPPPGEPLWTDARIDSLLGWSLIRAYLVATPRMFATLADVGLTPTQFGVLVQLDNTPRQSQAELARRSLMTPQSMGEILVSLERAGYVERGERPGRGHPIPVSLTAEGRAALARATPLVDEINTAGSFGLTPEESDIVNLLLHKIIRAVPGQP